MKTSPLTKIAGTLLIVASVLGMLFAFLAYSFAGFCQSFCLQHLIALSAPIISLAGIISAVAMLRGKNWGRPAALVISILALIYTHALAFNMAPNHHISLTNYIYMTAPAFVPLIFILLSIKADRKSSSDSMQ